MNSSNQIDDLLNRLADVPRRIRQAVARLSDMQKHLAPADDDWSAEQILAHLRASDDILAHRLYAILTRDNPILPAYDERRWAEIAGYPEADFELSLKVFALRRAELVRMLRQVASEDWGRLGNHETKGAISLFQVAVSLLEHEEEHCVQLEAL
jgi:DinB superfamily